MPGDPRRGRWRPLALAAGLGALALPAVAGEWSFTPRFTVQETYTDNVGLDPDGQEESDLVTDVNPGFSLRGEGRRLDLQLDYNLQAVVVSQEVDKQVNHQLDGDATAELVRELLFLDLDTTVSQRNATNTGRLARSNISDTGNRIDTITYRVSPYLRRRLKNYADTELRYALEEVINEGPSADSREHQATAEIASGSYFGRLPWRVGYNGRFIEFSDRARQRGDDSATLQRIDGTLRYLFSRQYSVFVNGGLDVNDFTTTGEEDGPFWRVGGTWRPSRRTTLEASYGDAYFGSNFSFTLRHRSRRTVWRLSFDEEATTTQRAQLRRDVFRRTDPFGQPVVEPFPGNRVRAPTDLATPVAEVVVTQRFEGSVAFRGRRTDLRLEGFTEDREFQATGSEERVVGAEARAIRRLSRFTDASVEGLWQDTELRAGLGEFTRWEAALELRHRIGPMLDGGVEYRYTSQDGRGLGGDFDENRVSAFLTVIF